MVLTDGTVNYVDHQPGRVTRVIMMNTWAWPHEEEPALVAGEFERFLQ